MAELASPGAPVDVDAVLFDLLTALTDSWSAWNAAAGSETDGRRWRQRYLDLTYAAGDYRPYADLVHESAAIAHVPHSAAQSLLDHWGQIAPWPEVPGLLRALGSTRRIGVVTNCSTALAEQVVRGLGYPVDVLVAAERAGAYKPDPRPYRMALDELSLPAERVLFVAGSPFDIPGAGGMGMPVIWHNRARLERPAGITAPLAELATLDDLPRLLGRREEA